MAYGHHAQLHGPRDNLIHPLGKVALGGDVLANLHIYLHYRSCSSTNGNESRASIQ